MMCYTPLCLNKYVPFFEHVYVASSLGIQNMPNRKEKCFQFVVSCTVVKKINTKMQVVGIPGKYLAVLLSLWNSSHGLDPMSLHMSHPYSCK